MVSARKSLKKERDCHLGSRQRRHGSRFLLKGIMVNNGQK